MPVTVEASTLLLQNDRHQKQYNVELIRVPGVPALFVVNFAYGAIGKALTPGTKTKTPVVHEKARAIYLKLLNEKTSKRCECCQGQYVSTGHRPAVSSPVAQRAINSPAHTLDHPLQAIPAKPRFSPELLEPVDIAPTSTSPDTYTRDPSYGAMRKYDGIRLSVRFDGETMVGYNRKAEPVTVPAPVELELRAYGWPVMLDGEWIASEGKYVAFDLLALRGKNLASETFAARHRFLSAIPDMPHIIIARLATTLADKVRLLADEVAAGGEGVVYKKLASPYMPGRQGINMKRKLWASATVRVCAKKKEDGKNSFAMEVLRGDDLCVSLADGPCNPGPCNPCTTNACAVEDSHCAHCGEDLRWVSVGTVTCTKTRTIPESGTYREVKYLYCGAGGNLVQAEDLGPRTDVDDSDCGFAQLKRKQTEGVTS